MKTDLPRVAAFVLASLAVDGAPARVVAQEAPVRAALVKMPYHGERNVAERSGGPDYLEAGGLEARLRAAGVQLSATATIALTPAESRQYGEWHRLGLANRHLGDVVARNLADGVLTIGLLANCNALIGVLGGLQRSGGVARSVGLVFIDAHGDFNTPETTLSGMLGGMPVAVSAGLGLHNLRRTSGLDPAIETDHIVLAAARDLDPLEAELLAREKVVRLSVRDLRDRGGALQAALQSLAAATDVIYVHVDMDVLDPAEVPGHPLTVPDGPTSEELAGALTDMFRDPKVAALGIASTPWGDRDPDGLSLRAAYRLIDGALEGVRQRSSR
ncbi:MAG: arginase family protein [Gemmatimonadetes bacterium]|nr:arginase family protein [Gemmatimonadota bacterium]